MAPHIKILKLLRRQDRMRILETTVVQMNLLNGDCHQDKQEGHAQDCADAAKGVKA